MDLDNDGVINEQEFHRLIEREVSSAVKCSKEDVSYFLQVLDPFNTQKITFSEMVQLFSSHMVPHSISEERHGLLTTP